MNKTRKLTALLLVVMMSLTMVFSIATAEEIKVNFVKTTGGDLNMWPNPVKKAGTAIALLPYGTVLVLTGNIGYDKVDEITFKEVTAAGKTGWVDARYIGTKTVTPAPAEEFLPSFEGKAATTGGNLNIWANKNFTVKVDTVKNGTLLGTIVPVKGQPYGEVYNYDGEFVGYVRMRYVAKVVPPAPPAPAPEPAPEIVPKWLGWVESAVVTGTAWDSIIYLWKTPAKSPKALTRLPVGAVVTDVDMYSDGMSWVYYSLPDGETFLGYVATKYLTPVE